MTRACRSCRSRVVHATLAVVLAVLAGTVAAQPADYPARPIRLVIGFTPGGAADFVARAMSDAFGKALGQSVVVDNKPGNGSSIAAEIVARSRPMATRCSSPARAASR